MLLNFCPYAVQLSRFLSNNGAASTGAGEIQEHSGEEIGTGRVSGVSIQPWEQDESDGE